MANENYQPESWVEIRSLEELLQQAEARKSSHDTLTEKYRLIHVDVFESFFNKSLEIDRGPNLSNPHVIEFRRREAIEAAIKKARELQKSASEKSKSETDLQIARIQELTRWDDEERAARQALKNGLKELYKRPEIRKSVHCLALLNILTNRLNGIEPFADLLAPISKSEERRKSSKGGLTKAANAEDSPNKIAAKNFADIWSRRPEIYKNFAEFCRVMEDKGLASESSLKRWKRDDWIEGPHKPKNID
ncbi:hypothetical protein [Comamonas odontotermitis]|uniref:hypothetical protein n=1 Tax=Comamonas odontotermitis TaxID=379895 RepID=UPI003751A552